jgi:hypothetical protein
MRNRGANRIIRLALAVGLCAVALAGGESPAGGARRGQLRGWPAAALRAADQGENLGSSVAFHIFLGEDGLKVPGGVKRDDGIEPKMSEKTFTFALTCFRIPFASLMISIRKQCGGASDSGRR